MLPTEIFEICISDRQPSVIWFPFHVSKHNLRRRAAAVKANVLRGFDQEVDLYDDPDNRALWFLLVLSELG